ncbi:hypothetical protein SEA_MARGARET_59 [Gordonia phage Margaret]|nr:hypothetical protein SEA_MARGARET_59 [Gordonia phage Margaret]
MSFSIGDRVMVESPGMGYDPPWCVGKVTDVGDSEHWDGWVQVEAGAYEGVFNGGKPYWYPGEAVRHVD